VIRGLIDSGGAMMARSLQTDITSNNLANTQTTGFKLDRLNFRDLIDHRLVVDRGRGVPNPENPSALRHGNPLDRRPPGSHRARSWISPSRARASLPSRGWTAASTTHATATSCWRTTAAW
jgi:hypothetical protein